LYFYLAELPQVMNKNKNMLNCGQNLRLILIRSNLNRPECRATGWASTQYIQYDSDSLKLRLLICDYFRPRIAPPPELIGTVGGNGTALIKKSRFRRIPGSHRYNPSFEKKTRTHVRWKKAGLRNAEEFFHPFPCYYEKNMHPLGPSCVCFV
jgi:hypothetical protein